MSSLVPLILCLIGISLLGSIIFAGAGIRIVQEYERGVIFRLGRVQGAKGPGLFVVVPWADRMQKVDLRVVTLDLPSQECITIDNVTVRVNAVVFYQIVDPVRAVVSVQDYRGSIFQIAQTTLRSVLGQSELDDLLAHRDKINLRLREIIDQGTEAWGIQVGTVEVKDVELPQSMQRAMARQAEAERERRAKVIHAEGEYAASQQLAQAASTLSNQPGALQLRYLQTLTEIGVEHNTTIVFPMPIDMMEGLSSMLSARGAQNGSIVVSPTVVPSPPATVTPTPEDGPAAS